MTDRIAARGVGRVRRFLPGLCVAILLAAACGGQAGDEDARRDGAGPEADRPAADAGAAEEGPAARQGSELQEVNRFLSYAAADSLVDLKLWAGYGGANSAWNFDGYYAGNATIVVPLGWRVEATYQTLDANVPHSAAVVEPTRPIPMDGSGVRVAFRGASTPSFLSGLSSTEEPVKFSFRADEAGRYWIFCGVPGHGRAGMWIWFEVSEEATAPDFRTDTGGSGGNAAR